MSYGNYGRQNMRFRNNVLDKNIPEALKIVEGLLSAGSNMLEEIIQKNDFKYNSGGGAQVALKLLRQKEPINIYIYRPWNKFTSAVGYYGKGAIHINIYFLDKFDTTSLAGFLLHEYAHYCGFHHNSSLGTSNFKTQDKVLHSVPYFLSENVGKWI